MLLSTARLIFIEPHKAFLDHLNPLWQSSWIWDSDCLRNSVLAISFLTLLFSSTFRTCDSKDQKATHKGENNRWTRHTSYLIRGRKTALLTRLSCFTIKYLMIIHIASRASQYNGFLNYCWVLIRYTSINIGINIFSKFLRAPVVVLLFLMSSNKYLGYMDKPKNIWKKTVDVVTERKGGGELV